MQRYLAYCFLSLGIGALMWPVLVAWPLTRTVLISPAFLHARETWLIQVAAMSVALFLTTQLLRTSIQQATKLSEFGITSLRVVLTSACFFGMFFVAAAEIVGILETGSFDEDPAVAFLGLLSSAIAGIFFGVVSLPILIPFGICGVYLLKCVLGRQYFQSMNHGKRC